MTRSAGAVIAGACLLALACDAGAPAPSSEDTRQPVRVVSLAPLATRFVMALGAAEQLVGVDASSAQLQGLAGLPVVTADQASGLRPDLILVPERSGNAAAFGADESAVVEFAPHDMEDVLALIRDVGGRLLGAEGAMRFQVALSRPLAKIGGASRGQVRPRVVAVVDTDPLVIAGGHSFETDLIEIAGGYSVTHPGEEPRLEVAADAWAGLDPDLVWVVTDPAASSLGPEAWRSALPGQPQVVLLELASDFWLGDPAVPARQLRSIIEPLAVRLSGRKVDATR